MLFSKLINTLTDVVLLIIKIINAYIECICHLFINIRKKDVKNQVILITGSGHGLGRELALLFAKLGAKIALVDVNQENNDCVADDIRNSGGIAFSYICDITSEESIAKIAKQIKWDLGDVDILINNAGIVQCLPIDSLSSQHIKRTFEVNTLAHFWTIRYFLPIMISRGSGHIVAIASIAGLIGTAHLVDYCASKFAIVGLMEALETELRADKANDNINLTTICPLAMTTGMFKSPKSRFSSIFPVVDAQYVAKETVNAILQNQTIITVPKSAQLFYNVGKIVPLKAKLAMQQFFGYGVDPHN